MIETDTLLVKCPAAAAGPWPRVFRGIRRGEKYGSDVRSAAIRRAVGCDRREAASAFPEILHTPPRAA